MSVQVVRPGEVTMKGLAANLTGKWLVSPHWIEDSYAAKRFVPPEAHGRPHARHHRAEGIGRKGAESPFAEKRVAMTPAFVRSCLAGSERQHATVLLRNIGRVAHTRHARCPYA